MPLPEIEPPLLNSANPWATTQVDLQSLFDCPSTGAVTTRTSLLQGFAHDDKIHQHTFFDARNHSVTGGTTHDDSHPYGSLNTLGYSPLPLSSYLTMLPKIVSASSLPSACRSKKAFIISVTGSAEEVRQCYEQIRLALSSLDNPLAMEINLSCPNIPGKPPPAYSRAALQEYLRVLGAVRPSSEGRGKVYIGIKTPPYTYFDQFQTLVDALLDSSSRSAGGAVDFITAVNTLGSSLVLRDEQGSPAIASASGAGIGGMAGAPLHPLALGNVKTLREMLDGHEQLREIEIVGIGGVGDRAGFERMRAVGAKVVGVGTALGAEGVSVFDKILDP